jgi:hypothetical protein
MGGEWTGVADTRYARSFQLSAWMMLPSLYDQVIFS